MASGQWTLYNNAQHSHWQHPSAFSPTKTINIMLSMQSSDQTQMKMQMSANEAVDQIVDAQPSSQSSNANNSITVPKQQKEPTLTPPSPPYPPNMAAIS